MRYSYDVFISYNYAQKSWVRKLVAKLRKAGIVPFFDEQINLAGYTLPETLAEGVLKSRCSIVVLSPESAKSDWVGFELQHAIFKDPSYKEKRIIPILFRECKIPTAIKPIVYIDFTKGLRPKPFGELVDAIRNRRIIDEIEGPNKNKQKWWWCNSSVTSNLTELYFTDILTGWVVGEKGTIISTNDGGRIWKNIDSGTDKDLYSIAFHKDGKQAWIVGREATILETINGGKSWNSLKTGYEEEFYAVDICDGNKAVCIVGSNGIILKKKIGKIRWKRIRSSAKETIWSVHFSQEGKLGCAVGAHGTILVSNNEGNTWQKKRVETMASLYSSTVLRDNKTIWVVGDEGTILVSRNEGKIWENRPYPMSAWDGWLNSADFSYNGETGWVVGASGTMLNTADGGVSWSKYTIEGVQDLVNIMYQNEETIWVIGNNGIILSTKQS